MALTTYAELQTSIGSWLARDDLTSVIPDFITLFEAAANRRLRARQQETSTTLTPASGSVTLPTDYLAYKRVTWTGSTRIELEYVHPSVLQSYYPDTPSGTPTIFTIEGSTLKIRPTSTTDLEFEYFQKIPVLSTTNTTNWLLTAHPDLYLFGSLCEAELFNKDAEKALVWKQRRDACYEEIEKLSEKTKGPASIRVMGTVV